MSIAYAKKPSEVLDFLGDDVHFMFETWVSKKEADFTAMINVGTHIGAFSNFEMAKKIMKGENHDFKASTNVEDIVLPKPITKKKRKRIKAA